MLQLPMLLIRGGDGGGGGGHFRGIVNSAATQGSTMVGLQTPLGGPPTLANCSPHITTFPGS